MFGFRFSFSWWNYRAVIFCVHCEGLVSAEYDAMHFSGTTSSRSVCRCSLERWKGGLGNTSPEYPPEFAASIRLCYHPPALASTRLGKTAELLQ